MQGMRKSEQITCGTGALLASLLIVAAVVLIVAAHAGVALVVLGVALVVSVAATYLLESTRRRTPRSETP